MIRRFFGFLLTLALAFGCWYFGWQAYTLRTKVAQLQAEVEHLKRSQSHHSGHGGSKERVASTSGESEDSAAAEGWIALANEHADKAKAAFDAHNYGIAVSEFNQAVDDVKRGTDEPVQATESTVAAIRLKLAQLGNGMSGILGQAKGAAGQ